MTLIESIRSELLPVGPYLLQHLRVVSVFLSALDELRSHGVNDVFFLLSHRLAQSVTLTTGEVSKLPAEQHHLLLIYGDTISILKVLFHTGNVVRYLFTTVLTCNERRDIIHRSRTIQSIHSNKVFEYRRVQLSQIVLHTTRLKLEGSYSLSLLVQFKCFCVVNRYLVKVYFLSRSKTYILHSLLQLR